MKGGLIALKKIEEKKVEKKENEEEEGRGEPLVIDLFPTTLKPIRSQEICYRRKNFDKVLTRVVKRFSCGLHLIDLSHH